MCFKRIPVRFPIEMYFSRCFFVEAGFVSTTSHRSFLGFNILNLNFFGRFQKNEYFWGYEDFVDICFGSSQNWTLFRGHFYAF